MQLTTRLPRRRTGRQHRSARPEPPAPRTVQSAERADARRGGGPQDRALYSCVCGFVFTAPVTTSVACPHCGTEQAW